jgi:hypothetical protein
MRFLICILTLLIMCGTTAAIAYLLGHSRALGHEEWRFEGRLVRAYAGEILLHAGPLALLSIASLLALYQSARLSLVVLIVTAIGSSLLLYATRETVQAYIVASPGASMRMPSDCTAIIAILWLAAFAVLIGMCIACLRRKFRRRESI